MNRKYRYTPRSVRRTYSKNKLNLIISIVLIFVFGFFLFSWGLPALVGGLSVFNFLKPKTEKAQNLEDSAIAPPVLNIPFEATNSATIIISGYSTPNSEVEIYFDDEIKTITETTSDGNFRTEELELSLGTNNIYGKTINEKGDKSLSSKNIRLIYDNEKPNLEISEPSDNFEIKGGDKKIKVSGKTEPENSVTVNGITVIVGNDGGFSKEVSLNDGDNTIEIISTNLVGNSTKVAKIVKYSP